MCGISAILDAASGPGIASELRAMHAVIPHRGPDGEGFAFVDSELRVRDHPSESVVAALGFRWLQIQDTSDASRQPFRSADGSVIVLYNGEIYNFPELRAELEREGHAFRTRSDTEVLTTAYQQWGTGCFARFRGMWAVVLIDLAGGNAVVSRDRFGIKPLFYRRSPRRLSFASEVKQLLAGGAARDADHDMLLHFLVGSRLPGRERTFFRDIQAVPPGTYGVVPLGVPAANLDFVCYWNLAPGLIRDELSIEDALAELRPLMEDVVRLHTRATVPVGSFLSGGVDSSLINGIAKSIGVELPTFSMTPGPDAGRLDESSFIEATSRALGVRNARIHISGSLVHEFFDRVARAHEEPLGGIALIAQYLTYGLARERGARVVLDGQGSDEQFAGYGNQTSEYLLDLLLRLRLWRGAREIAAFARRDRRALTALIRRAGAVLVIRPLGLRRHAPRHPWLQLRSSEVERLTASAREASFRAPGRTHLSRLLWTDTMSLNLYDVLSVGDRNSMAHSVESRVPFVDHVLTEFAFTLPDEMKIGNGWRKRILRLLASDLIPPAVAWRPDKMGFAVPQALWMRRHFEPEFRSLADNEAIASLQLIRRNELRAMVERFLRGSDTEAGPLWRILGTARWAEIHSVRVA